MHFEKVANHGLSLQSKHCTLFSYNVCLLSNLLNFPVKVRKPLNEIKMFDWSGQRRGSHGELIDLQFNNLFHGQTDVFAMGSVNKNLISSTNNSWCAVSNVVCLMQTMLITHTDTSTSALQDTQLHNV